MQRQQARRAGPGAQPRASRRAASALEAYVPGDRRRALAAGATMPDQVSGSAIFADISGFTPLTEALSRELGPQEGAEELQALLDTVFDAVLHQLHLHGGSVIYLSGDAVTCWIDGDDGLLGASCGLAMQRAMAGVAEIETPGGNVVQLGMKVAVVCGRARRFVVGDPAVQRIDVLAGALMDRLAEAEHRARSGEVVLDAATCAALGERAIVAACGSATEAAEPGAAAVPGAAAAAAEPGAAAGAGGEGFAVLRELAVAVRLPAPPEYPRLAEDQVREWMLPAVYERLGSGRSDFLAELRPAVPMFVRFGGIDYDEHPEALSALDRFVSAAQRIIDGYGGTVLQLTIGDKGAYLYAAFGAPIAHEDDAARACSAALEVVGLDGSVAARGLQVGLASDRLWSGAYGHSHRRAFTCLGDAVNLAARLMTAAPAGQVYLTSRLAAEAGESFAFEKLADITVKGKAEPVAVRRLIGRGRAVARRSARPKRPLLGRRRELEQLLGIAEHAGNGRGQVVGVVAEAGMGKSRLVEEALATVARRGTSVHAGAAASVGSAISYLVWQPVWHGLLGIGELDPLGDAERALGDVDDALVGRLPLLGAALGLGFEDNELTARFDAKLRKSSLESLLVRYLTLRAARAPLALLLEDCHWIDPLSLDLLDVVARTTASLPVLLVLTYRPGSFAAPALPHTTLVELDRLDKATSEQLLVERMTELYGPEVAPHPSLVRRLDERAEGNPFYLEELVNYLHGQQASVADPSSAGALELPSSLASLVLSRIDRLAEPPRRTLKVASVVGREFTVDVVSGAHRALGSRRGVTAHLDALCREDLTVRDGPVGDRYAFKHAVVREVAYDSLPARRRRLLHADVGRFLEISEPASLDLLAHHFWNSDDEARKKRYLGLAGEAAQARFANDAAVDYFRRLAPLVADDERAPVLMRLGAVLELRGDWAEAEAVLGEAVGLTERLGDEASAAKAQVARADPIRKQGRYDEAIGELEAAAGCFERTSDDAGLGRVAHLRGTIAAQRGDYAEARLQYERSLEIRMALGDGAGEASVLSNLAIVAEYEEDYRRALELNGQALALRTALGDRWGIGVSENNLGMVAYLLHDFESARRHLEEALRAELEVGDTWMVAIARHNLGNAARELAERLEAGRHYAEALATYSLTGDKWAQCLLFEDIAMLAIEVQPQLALRLIGVADAMREAIGSPRVAAQQAELDAKLASVRERLGERCSTAEHRSGRDLSRDDAQELATRLCAVAGR